MTMSASSTSRAWAITGRRSRGPLCSVTYSIASSAKRRQVVDCLGALADMQRECIELAYYEGLTYVQVSERLSTNLATIKSRMRDALHGLRNCLGVQ
jgi:RNA polymerase sigma-70 factor, ECF subfamily